MLVVILSPEPGEAVVEAGGADDLVLRVEDGERYEGALEERDQLGVIIEQVQLGLVLLSDEAVESLNIVMVSPPHEVIVDYA